jgi:glucan phosphoethanolaminetransferase (alkaline phosphatase superfamily)
LETPFLRVRRALAGARPGPRAWLAAPTLLAFAIDLALRPRALLYYSWLGKLIYVGGLVLSASFWGLPLWAATRLVAAPPSRARTAGLALVGAFILPFATFGFGGQLLYFRVFGAFMGRDTLRLGIALRGTVRDWFAAWGGPWLAMALLVGGAALTYGALRIAKRTSEVVGVHRPVVPAFLFVLSLTCFWIDAVDSSFLQRATPDVCFAHGVVHAARVAVTGGLGKNQGVSIRTPAPVPPLVSSKARPPDVVLIVTESVRADATCSAPPPRCTSPELDAVIADRMALGKLTTQTPNTFSTAVVMWTGLPPTFDFVIAHTAPLLWEVAHAVGYRTAYISAQNPDYEDFGLFTRRAGIDVLVDGNDLGGMAQEQLGAPDENAVARALRFVEESPSDRPWFLVLHLSNTHAPYRVDPALTPFEPHSNDPLGNSASFHNRYKNAVRLQERTLAPFFAALKRRPAWNDTAVVFVSDHGESFREHGTLYHNHSLHDEEVRVPGFLVAGLDAVPGAARWALASYAKRRTYTQDIHATVLDLFGVLDERGKLPFADRLTGRSLLRISRGPDPAVLAATSTSVWEPDEERFGVMRGERALWGPPKRAWSCWNLATDPLEKHELPARDCGDLVEIANREFPGLGRFD